MATTMKQHQMFIGGEWVDATTGETEPDIDPSTGEAYAGLGPLHFHFSSPVAKSYAMIAPM
jgi:hypothetical protein